MVSVPQVDLRRFGEAGDVRQYTQFQLVLLLLLLNKKYLIFVIHGHSLNQQLPIIEVINFSSYLFYIGQEEAIKSNEHAHQYTHNMDKTME